MTMVWTNNTLKYSIIVGIEIIWVMRETALSTQKEMRFPIFNSGILFLNYDKYQDILPILEKCGTIFFEEWTYQSVLMDTGQEPNGY